MRASSRSPDAATPPLDLRRQRRGRQLALLAALFAALFVIPFKVAAADGHGRGAALGLLIGVTLWFWAPALWRWHRSSPARRLGSVRLALLLTLAAALGNVAQGLAFARLHAGVAAVVLQSQLLWVALLGRVWLKERVSLALGAGLALCITGVAVMQGVGSARPELETGVLWALLAAFAFALMDVTSRRHAADADSMVANVGRSALAALVIAWVPGSVSELFTMTAHQLGALAIASLLGPGLARQLLIMSARELPASQSSLLQQLRPVLALPLTSVFFGVWPYAREWAGSGLIVLGVGLPLAVGYATKPGKA